LSDSFSNVLGVTRALLKILRVINLLAAAILIICVIGSFLFEPRLLESFSRTPGITDAAFLMNALRIWVLIGLPVIAAIHIILSRLLEMIGTVREGDPFVPENAARLKVIAWCLLVAQLFHLAFGVMAGVVNRAGADVDWSFSINGWLAVILFFVLARVFEEGTRMREELGTMI
jgi:hypothetical protein